MNCQYNAVGEPILYKYVLDLSDTEELRDEIKLYTCRTLVHKVKLFEDVPASVVGTVLGCLHPEVYLANDLVVRAGDIGDCMYFIATGTVAVYSLKGVEVWIPFDSSRVRLRQQEVPYPWQSPCPWYSRQTAREV